MASRASRHPCRLDVVESQADAYKWAEHHLAIGFEHFGGREGVGETMKANLKKLTMSTCFSGIGLRRERWQIHRFCVL